VRPLTRRSHELRRMDSVRRSLSASRIPFSPSSPTSSYLQLVALERDHLHGHRRILEHGVLGHLPPRVHPAALPSQNHNRRRAYIMSSSEAERLVGTSGFCYTLSAGAGGQSVRQHALSNPALTTAGGSRTVRVERSQRSREAWGRVAHLEGDVLVAVVAHVHPERHVLLSSSRAQEISVCVWPSFQIDCCTVPLDPHCLEGARRCILQCPSPTLCLWGVCWPCGLAAAAQPRAYKRQPKPGHTWTLDISLRQFELAHRVGRIEPPHWAREDTRCGNPL
jgi:hypothetical protein